MEKERYSRLYNVHSRSGVILGLFVYIVSFTGCVALFYNEIQTWEDPAKRLSIAETPAKMMPVFQTWVKKNTNGREISSLRFIYPKQHTPYFSASIETKDQDGKKFDNTVRWDSFTGVELADKKPGLSQWLRDIHRQFMWPASLGGKTVGRALVGIIGLILMLLIITGVITHTKIIKQIFTLRTERSRLLKWQDLHKVLGLWPLPFHTMIAFTGTFVGVISIFTPAIAVLAFKGDTESLKAAVLGEQRNPAGIEAKMVSVDKVGEMRFPDNNSRPLQVVIRNWGDQNALYDVQYPVSSELATVNRVTLNGVSADIIKYEPANGVPSANRVINTLTPLHYGNYGGVSLKFLYLILGLILSFVTASGLIIWIKRRLQRDKNDSTITQSKIGKVTIGVTLGLPIASIAIFYVDKLFVGAEHLRMITTGGVYFAAWISIITYACVHSNSLKYLFLLAGTLMLGIPLLNHLSTGDSFWLNLNPNQSWAWVDLSFLLIGMMTIAYTQLIFKRSV